MLTLTTEILIIGAGVAGLSALMTAQEQGQKTLIINKGKMFASGSTFINRNGRWGLSFARTEEEKEILLERINAISHETNTPRLSEILVEESHIAYEKMKSWGVKMVQLDGKELRVNPCYLSSPLAVIIESTLQFASAISGKIDWTKVEVLQQARAEKIVMDNNCCSGCLVRKEDQEILVKAGKVILATGGAGANFPASIVEPDLTGDGYKLLSDNGIKLENMVYQQKIWQKTEKGERGYDFPVAGFFDDSFEFKDYAGNVIRLPPLSDELICSRMSHAPLANLQEDEIIDKVFLPHIDRPLPGRGIKVYTKKTGSYYCELLPYVQACNGGVLIGDNGETGIENLYAAGELTTGMHGGDRVGGMMITSSMVFGRRAALHACCGVID